MQSDTTETEPGRHLRRVREQLRLRYRDVEQASLGIASQHGNPEFAIGLSRLADIENKGTIPSIFRLYSICVIYGLNFSSVLQWYGVKLDQMPGDAASLNLQQTRTVDFQNVTTSFVQLPEGLEDVDLRRTSYVSRQIRKWGKFPVDLLHSLDLVNHRYAFIGTDDWSMYPIINPGAFVQIDESAHRVVNGGWANDYQRPIYLVEYRGGFRCSWCSERAGMLILQPPSASPVAAEVYRFPGEAEILGQIVAIAMRLDPGKQPRKRS